MTVWDLALVTTLRPFVSPGSKRTQTVLCSCPDLDPQRCSACYLIVPYANTNWADLNQRPAGETICSQVLEDIKANWKGWENDKSMKLAELIDIRNGGPNIRFTLKEARDLLLWGYQEVLPLIRVPKVQAEPATAEAPAGGGGKRRARAGAQKKVATKEVY